MVRSQPLICGWWNKPSKRKKKGPLGPFFCFGEGATSPVRLNAIVTMICTAGRHVRRPKCFRTGCDTSSNDGSSAYERSHPRCRLPGFVVPVLLSMSRATWVPPLGGFWAWSVQNLVAKPPIYFGRLPQPRSGFIIVAPHDRLVFRARVRWRVRAQCVALCSRTWNRAMPVRGEKCDAGTAPGSATLWVCAGEDAPY